jgi:hypothetical protein
MVRRLQLGARLRDLRLAAGVPREEAGYAIRGSESKISRMELGRVSFKERDIVDLLRLYGVEDQAEQARLLALAREANSPGWWQEYGDAVGTWFQNYLDLEQAAELIRTYEVQFVPGLLQTADYARSVVLLGHGRARPDEIDRRVDLRMRRQSVLDRPDPVQLWAVIDEAVLRRPVGSRAAMRGQIEALIDATARRSIHLQVLPFQAGGHSAAGGAFSILRFPDQELPDIVYVEQLSSALYLDKRDDVELYVDAMERLAVEADPPERAADTLRKILKDT